MVSTALAFVRACEAEGYKHDDPRDVGDQGKTDVTLGVSGSAGNSYKVRFIFDEDGESVAVRVFGFVKATGDSFAKLLVLCNQLNDKYRWVKFCIDDDKDLNIEADCVITERTAGTVCCEMFGHVMSIAKKAYPEFMKAIWGGAE